jgi:hypothetical protein
MKPPGGRATAALVRKTTARPRQQKFFLPNEWSHSPPVSPGGEGLPERQVGHLAITGNCPHGMLPGVIADGQGELRLASGSAVPAAAGELKEPRCEPGAAFEHEQVPGAVRFL